MLIVTQEVHDEMVAVWATSGLALMSAMGFKTFLKKGVEEPIGGPISGGFPDLGDQPASVVETLRFVAEQRLAARKPRRRVRTKTAAKP